MQDRTLFELEIGSSGKIIRMDLLRDDFIRLNEMGIVEGSLIKKIMDGVYDIDHCRFVIGKLYEKRIFVKNK